MADQTTSPRPTRIHGPRWRDDLRSPLFFAALLVFLGALAAYGTSLPNDLRLDDGILITQNHILHEPQHLVRLLGKPYLEGYYRPFVFFSFFLDFQIWGLNPLGYHLTNFLLHFANALLVLFLIRALLGNLRLATLTAVLFVIHPLQYIAVNYIADRGNLLVAFFGLIGLLCLRQGFVLPRRKLGFFLAGYFCFVLALLSRENGVLFPLYAALIFFTLDKHKDLSARLFIFASLATDISYFILRKQVFPFSSLVLPPLAQGVLWHNISTFCYVIFQYVRTALIPGDIHIIREITLPPLGALAAILFPLFVAGLFFLCLAGVQRKNAVFFGATWFLAGVLPLYGFMFSRPQIGFFMQDNHVYQASVGLFLLMAVGLEGARRRLPQRLWIFLVVTLCIGYAAKAVSSNFLYRDKEKFLKDWYRVAPHYDFLDFSLGQYYENDRQEEKAIAYYKKSLTGDLTDAKALCNLGNIAFSHQDLETARRYYIDALQKDPHLKEVRLGLSTIFMEQEDFRSAELLLLDGNRAEPDWPWWRLSLVTLKVRQAKYAEAQRLAQSVIHDFPSLETPYYMLVWLRLIQRDMDGVFKASETVLRMAPDSKAACRNLGELFKEAGFPRVADAFNAHASGSPRGRDGQSAR